MLKSGEKITLATITDGTSNTFMVAEAGKPVIWTKPEDMPFDGKKLPDLGGMFDGSFTAVMGDGAARNCSGPTNYTPKVGAIPRSLKLSLFGMLQVKVLLS